MKLSFVMYFCLSIAFLSFLFVKALVKMKMKNRLFWFYDLFIPNDLSIMSLRKSKKKKNIKMHKCENNENRNFLEMTCELKIIAIK